MYKQVAQLIIEKASMRRQRQAFLRRQARLEREYIGILLRYFKEQRQRVMGLFPGHKKDLVLDKLRISRILDQLETGWFREIEELKDISQEPIENALLMGVRQAISNIENAVGVSELNTQVALLKRTNKLRNVSMTTFNQIKAELGKGLNLGESIDTMADRIDHMFDLTNRRAIVIARTETSSAMSEGSLMTYKDNDVKLKRIVTAGDDRVRATHTTNASAGAIPVDQSFPGTGEMYPGETEIMCRCALIPVIV